MADPLNQARESTPKPSPEYVAAGGYRHVVPYQYGWHTTVKGRWLKKALIEVISAEFAGYNRAYFEAAIEAGVIHIDGKAAAADYIMPGKGVLSHTAHRHEPPVVWQGDIEVKRYAPPAVESESDEDCAILAVHKPPSWPVHPTGGFRKNTLSHYLEHERGHARLHMLYRIDRLVSGVVLFATSPSVCASFLKSMQSFDVNKVYLARVAGRLDPEHLQASSTSKDDAAVSVERVESWPAVRSKLQLADEAVWSSVMDVCSDCTSSSASAASSDGSSTASSVSCPHTFHPHLVHVKHAIREVIGKRGRFESVLRPTVEGDDGSKPCHTIFVPLRYHPSTNTTDLMAVPITGRTHQIRVHLLGIGYPIANDPSYGGMPGFLRDPSGIVPRLAAPEAVPLIAAALERQRHDADLAAAAGELTSAGVLQRCPHCLIFNDLLAQHEAKAAGETSASQAISPSDIAAPSSLAGSDGPAPAGTDADEEDSTPGTAAVPFRSCIWLHALAYAGQGFCYAVQPPPWWRGSCGS